MNIPNHMLISVYNIPSMNTHHLSDHDIFLQMILPEVKKNYPESRIIDYKKVNDEFRVGLIRQRKKPNSGMIQTWMILNNQAVLISLN